MDYNQTGAYDRAAVGPFDNANKKTVWPAGDGSDGITQDFDTPGQRFVTVADDRFDGGKATRCIYRVGQVGMQDQSYQVRFPSPCNVANLRFRWLFEADFSFMTPNANKNCGGKIGPCIQWGEVGGVAENRGTRCMLWWNGHGSNYPPAGPKFSPSCQDQRSGNQLIQPVVYSEKIECERPYDFQIQVRGGPDGFARYWKDGQLFATVRGKMLQVSPEDHVYADFAFFSGGSGPDYGPVVESYGRCGNVAAWSCVESEVNWDDESPPAPPGNEPVPPDPDPDPEAGETFAFIAEGIITLKPRRKS